MIIQNRNIHLHGIAAIITYMILSYFFINKSEVNKSIIKILYKCIDNQYHHKKSLNIQSLFNINNIKIIYKDYCITNSIINNIKLSLINNITNIESIELRLLHQTI